MQPSSPPIQMQFGSEEQFLLLLNSHVLNPLKQFLKTNHWLMDHIKSQWDHLNLDLHQAYSSIYEERDKELLGVEDTHSSW